MGSPTQLGRLELTQVLAEQLLDALRELLAGLELAAEADPTGERALERAVASDTLYEELLRALLRLMVLLYAEARGLGTPLVCTVWQELRAQALHEPERLSQQAEAYPSLVGALEGLEALGQLAPPSDACVLGLLERLLVREGEALDYRELEVEQLGGVYEALMGYEVLRIPAGEGPGWCLRPARVWVSAGELRAQPEGTRANWLRGRGLSRARAERLAKLFGEADEAGAQELLREASVRGLAEAKAGRLVVQPGEERRRTSSHYTPRSLSEPLVARSLAPLLCALPDEGARSEHLLELRICDPAMGSGAFLLAALRSLSEALVAAWTRDEKLETIAAEHGDPWIYARRSVARRCLYGVDKNPLAVELAKLSMWLEIGDPQLGTSFLDHALGCGDSLVGLDLDQLRALDWRPGRRGAISRDTRAQIEAVVERDLQVALELRQRGQAQQARAVLVRLRMIADCVVGAFFAHPKAKARRRELATRREQIITWLQAAPGDPPPATVCDWAARQRADLRPFHWWLELPELFWASRSAANEESGFDLVLGNPPFLGGSRIWPVFGPAYRDYLLAIHPHSQANGDLAAHFFRRASGLLEGRGVISFVATNTLAQGDTRASGLQPLMRGGARILAAETDVPWPGDAAVLVSIVTLAEGERLLLDCPAPTLDGTPVSVINSSLRPHPERPDPVRLHANQGLAFTGVKLYGQGFILDDEERLALLAEHPNCASQVRPYIGGEDVNRRADASPSRHVISLEGLSLEQAQAEFAPLVEIVRARVKPIRDELGGYAIAESRRKLWWRYGTPATDLFTALRGKSRCIVAARVSKHLCFTFQAVGPVFSEQLYVFALEGAAELALLSSRVHELWARLFSSTLGDGIRYTASDCFQTFPFPPAHTLTPESALGRIGAQLYRERLAFMREQAYGLTKTYNALEDPELREPSVVRLRELHLELDAAVLEAYGWGELAPPAYPTKHADPDAWRTFEGELLDRLFQLNAERAARQV